MRFFFPSEVGYFSPGPGWRVYIYNLKKIDISLKESRTLRPKKEGKQGPAVLNPQTKKEGKLRYSNGGSKVHENSSISPMFNVEDLSHISSTIETMSLQPHPIISKQLFGLLKKKKVFLISNCSVISLVSFISNYFNIIFEPTLTMVRVS